MVISKSMGERLKDAVIIFVLAAAALICILPIINTLAVSLSDKAKAEAGLVMLWPVDFTLASYEKLLTDDLFFNSFWISTKRVLIGGVLNMFFCIVMAFPLSREKKSFKARNIYMWFIVFTMLFSGGLIPWYMLISKLGLIDSFWALVLPGAV
ncbi:carbohydrate ABC transporter permease, partial [Candidatus Nomurabacteria bacterium]|nr:carbohydrate ABC transporter permease [Candidatus Nomurabacteria bacterium]